jgi:Ca2+-binding RTX toxin-like protein
MISHHRSRKLRSKTPGSRFFRLGCERLEDRSLLAVLFGATGGGANSDLYMVDTVTGAATTVGSIGFAVTGLAVDPSSGTLYGSTSNQSPNSPNSIITINKTTGVGTLVGPVGIAGEEVADLTFDAAGTLFGWTEIFTDDLVSIDTSTGAATQVGNSGIFTFGSGLADVNGTLFYSGDGVSGALRTVDKLSGLTTVVATLHGAPSNTDGIAAMAVNPDTGTLFAVALNDSDLIHPAYLVTIDTATGEVTTLGALPNDFDAIAFDYSPSPPPVVGYPDLDPGSSAVVSDPFHPGTSVLLVQGTSGNDNIVLDRVNTVTVAVSVNGVATSFLSSTFEKIVVIAGAGDDLVAVRASIATPAELFGDEGNDQLSGGRGNDIVHGGEGNDRLSGGAGNDVLLGDSGNDRLQGDAGNDSLSGGDGHDQIGGDAGHDTLFGEAGNDNLSGGSGNDYVFGGSGADQLSGDAGNDVLLGEEGNDYVQGGAGRDILIGGLGADSLEGQAHDDILIGGTTSYDDNTAALAAILQEWVSARSFTVRVANISSGVRSGGFALNSGTVQDDGATDILTGLAGQNWVFAGMGDQLTGKKPVGHERGKK